MLKNLLNVGEQKLEFDPEELKACLEIDGTEIDDEDNLRDLLHQNDVPQVIRISDRMEILRYHRIFKLIQM